MKLAEALIIRADLQTKISVLKNRINLNSKFQEGEKPDEDPIELLNQFDVVNEELKNVIIAINMTNCLTVVNGKSIMQMIVERDSMTKKASALQELAQYASERMSRYSKSEIKIFSAVNVAEIQKQADCISKKIRELDIKLQELNWITELVN